MSDAKSPLPDSMSAVRTLLFARLAEINRDLNQAHADLTLQIDGRSHNACLGQILYMESRIQVMRNLLLVFRELLGG